MASMLDRVKARIKATENPFVVSIAKHSPKYLGAAAFSGIVGLVMTKYYTHAFSPADYGVLALYISLFQYMQNFMAFSFDTSAQRVYFDYDREEQPEMLGTALLFMAGCSAIWCVVSVFAEPYVVNFMGGSAAIFWCTVALTIVYMFTNFLIRLAYNEHRSTLVARQGVLQTVLNHSFSVFFIAVAKLGVLGYQLGSFVSYGITGLFYRQSLARGDDLRVRWKFRTDILKRLGYFALPAFLTSAISISLSYLDRIFLQYFHGATAVGIYALGYTLGQGLSLAIDAVSNSIFPSLMRELESNYEQNIHKLKRFDIFFCGGLLLVGIAVYVLRYPIVALFSNANYRNSAEVLPIIVFTFVLGGWYKTVSGVLSYHSIVRFYPALTVVSFASTAALNWLLIPRYYGVGAAYAMFIGVFIYSSSIHVIARKYYFRLSRVVIAYTGVFVAVTLMAARAANFI